MKRTVALFFAVSFSYLPVAAAQDLAPPPPLTQQQQTQPQPQPQQTQPQQTQPVPSSTQPAPSSTLPNGAAPTSSGSATLAPPPPMQQQAPPPATTEQKLDDSKKEDSGRGIEFVYVNAQIGGVFDALGTFNNSLQIQQTNAAGAMFGAEAGIRLVWFTLGARFRYDTLPSAFNIWQLDAVAGFHIPLGSWDPYVSIHGGYSAIGTLDASNFKASDIAPCSTCTSQDAANGFSSKGANVGFSVGVDYYLAKFFSIGVEGGFELLFLHRDPLPIPAACSSDPTGSCQAAVQSNPLYQKSGDAAGVSVMASAHLALHL